MRTLLLSSLLVLIAGCTAQSAEEIATTTYGPDAKIGDGPVATYATFDPSGTPTAIGVSIHAKALDSMPSAMSDGHHCFDRNGDGAIENDTECLATHERVMPLRHNLT